MANILFTLTLEALTIYIYIVLGEIKKIALGDQSSGLLSRSTAIFAVEAVAVVNDRLSHVYCIAGFLMGVEAAATCTRQLHGGVQPGGPHRQLHVTSYIATDGWFPPHPPGQGLWRPLFLKVLSCGVRTSSADK